MKALFLAIQAYLNAQMPSIAWIDLWNNQLANLDNENPFPTPAVFVELMPVSWVRLNKAKRGTLTIKIHLVQESYASTFDGSVNQTQALSILDTADELDLILENFGNFTGVTTEVDNNHDQLIDTILEYQTTLEKSLVKGARTEVSLGLELDVKLEKPAN